MIKLIKAAALCAVFAALLTLAACADKNAETPVFGGAIYEETTQDAAAPSDRSMPQEDAAAPAEETPSEKETPPAAEEAPAPQVREEEPAPSEKENAQDTAQEEAQGEEETEYVLNINSKKFHYPWCSGVASMKEKNRQDFKGTRQEVIDMGYFSCGICKP